MTKEGFRGFVALIGQDSVSKQRLYLIVYNNLCPEHLTLAELNEVLIDKNPVLAKAAKAAMTKPRVAKTKHRAHFGQ